MLSALIVACVILACAALLEVFQIASPSAIVRSIVQSDDARLRQISGSGMADDSLATIFQAVKLNRHDVKILRRDRRRARAAYPDLTPDQLLESRWFAFDEADRVPSDGYFNSHGIVDKATGKAYLESAYESFVKPQYPNRASDEETDAFFVALKAKQKDERRTRFEKDGTFASMGGSGGSFSFDCTPGGNCVVRRAAEWANTGDKWTFPFVIDEWVEHDPWGFDQIKALPSFAQAVHETEKVTPTGVTMTISPASAAQSIPPGGTATIRMQIPQP